MLGKDAFNAMADADLDTALDRLQGGLTELALTEDARRGSEILPGEEAAPTGQDPEIQSIGKSGQ